MPLDFFGLAAEDVVAVAEEEEVLVLVTVERVVLVGVEVMEEETEPEVEAEVETEDVTEDETDDDTEDDTEDETEVEMALLVDEDEAALEVDVVDTDEVVLLAARTPVPETQSVRKATLRKLVNCIVMACYVILAQIMLLEVLSE